MPSCRYVNDAMCLSCNEYTVPRRLTVSLQELILDHTDIVGRLPGITRAERAAGVVHDSHLCGSSAAGLGRLPNLQWVSLINTEMSAGCGGGNGSCSSMDEALPW